MEVPERAPSEEHTHVEASEGGREGEGTWRRVEGGVGCGIGTCPGSSTGSIGTARAAASSESSRAISPCEIQRRTKVPL